MYKIHHSKDVDRLYVKRKEGRREGEDWYKSKQHIKQK
jgi:hypothetical protein